jgi:TatD DNase family protein
VSQIVAIGVTAEDGDEVVAMAQAHRGVFAAVGVQPNHVAEAQGFDWERIEALVEERKVVAVGETGLDRYWDHTPFALQQEWFDRQIDLALRHDLPLVIHCRDCERDIFEQLAGHNQQARGVLHSFTGAWEHAEAFLGLGLYLSFAGMVTFTNRKNDALREVAARIPLERLLVETDSPYLSPHPLRGKVNEPANVALTAARIAALRGMDVAELAQATTENASRLFRLPDDDTL